ncbi:chaperone protein dnaJ 20, chloroplastic-like [Senna tora]|uniref:Chaperone protein dnaJ 20, chloroplastic-like n=1 Tax=Senna tora TaxID=362788 RepID=A0A834X293_9FABA|nr:chaperone protein dnaJ 20, chloroplastic-like [Senna tora]
MTGSDCRFFYLPSPKPKPLSVTHKSLNFPTRTAAFASFRVKSAINVAEAPKLSFYELLGIPESGSLLDIKHAYKQLARKYHPDVSPPDRLEENTRLFLQVKEAYEILSDPRTRALYDKDIARGIHLAFSARRRYYDDDVSSCFSLMRCPNIFLISVSSIIKFSLSFMARWVIEQKSEWKCRWQSQLSELKKRSRAKDAGENMSWAARMRRRREESSNEL